MQNSYSSASPLSQKGASALNILVIMFIAASILTVALKIVPIFMDNRTVEAVIGSLMEESGPKGITAEEFKSVLGKRLTINNIRDFEDKFLTISQIDGRLEAKLHYEVRTNIFRNIDAVVTFDRDFNSNTSH
ncbi:MAG: DUF4845 domain-containing protein [Hahellaceae bacterium]|nr:DUF4845 domain-containing protein [Hahellaceae bacterium]